MKEEEESVAKLDAEIHMLQEIKKKLIFDYKESNTQMKKIASDVYEHDMKTKFIENIAAIENKVIAIIRHLTSREN
jgi:hypothetical protein